MRTRRALLQQEAYRPRSEEQQTRRIENACGWCLEQALVEGSCARKVVGVLCDLEDVHRASFAWSKEFVAASR